MRIIDSIPRFLALSNTNASSTLQKRKEISTFGILALTIASKFEPLPEEKIAILKLFDIRNITRQLPTFPEPIGTSIIGL